MPFEVITEIFSKLISLFLNISVKNKELENKLDVDPQRDDDASPMSSYRCTLRPT